MNNNLFAVITLNDVEVAEMRKFLPIGLLFLMVVSTMPKYVLGNYGHILFNKLYATPLTDTQRNLILYRTGEICHQICEVSHCPDHSNSYTEEALLQYLDSCYGDQTTPLYVITDTVHLASPLLYINRNDQSAEVNSGVVTLFNVDYLEVRLFMWVDTAENWTISVKAVHDAPPPVHLAIWLNDKQIGNLVFDKGDQSWETLSIQSPIPPGLHWLRIWYVDDAFDTQLNLDRNAYIEQVTIVR